MNAFPLVNLVIFQNEQYQRSIHNRIHMSLFNGISTFVGYLMQKIFS